MLDKGGYYTIKQPAEWREIYQNLLIPKINNASAHHVKNAYIKYLLPYEEYNTSFKNTTHSGVAVKEESGGTGVVIKKEKTRSGRVTPDSETNRRTSNRRRKLSESVGGDDDAGTSKDGKRGGKKMKTEDSSDSVITEEKKGLLDEKSEKITASDEREEVDVESDSTSSTSETDKQTGGRKSLPAGGKTEKKPLEKRRNSISSTDRKKVYKKGDKIRVKYGRHSFKLYNAKVVDIEVIDGKDVQYYVHYTGWNSRHDEWIQPWQIAGDTSSPPAPIPTPIPPDSANKSRPKASEKVDKKKQQVESDALPSKDGTVTEGDDDSNSSAKTSSARSTTTASADKAKTAAKKGGKARVRRCSTSSTPVTGSDLMSVEKRAASEEKMMMASEMGSNETPLTSTEKDGSATSTENNPSTSGRDSPDLPGLVKYPTGRRVSARRSKSPAQLKEILYGPRRPRRSPSSVQSDSGSSTKDVNEITAPEIDDSASESSRSNMSSGNPSPLTLWRENDLGTDPPKICDKPTSATGKTEVSRETAEEASSSPATRHSTSTGSDSVPQPTSPQEPAPSDTVSNAALVIAASTDSSSESSTSSSSKETSDSTEETKQKSTETSSAAASVTSSSYTASTASNGTSSHTEDGNNSSSSPQPSTSNQHQTATNNIEVDATAKSAEMPPMDSINQELTKEEDKCFKASTSKVGKYIHL